MSNKILSLLCVWMLATASLAAPVYNASNPINVGPGQVVTLWSAETPTPGNGTTSASQQVAPTPTASGTPLSVDIKFSGAPGVFEIDCQAAGSDTDTAYQTISNGNITTVDSTNNTAHLDYAGTAKYFRLLMRTRTNSVSVTATVTGG